MCNAMLLPRVTAFSAGGAVKRYADAARLMGLCDEGAADIDAAMGIPDALQRVTSDLRVPTLEGFGIDEAVFRKAVPSMAQAALASGSPNNNPIVPTATEVEALYHEIWDVGVGLRARGEAAA